MPTSAPRIRSPVLDLSSTYDLVRRHAIALMEYASIEAGREIVQEANKDTGYMATTTVVEPVQDNGTTMSADIYIPAPYAVYVIQGTRPHVITPRNARALAWEAGGHTVFARRVMHPGYAGNDFFFEPMQDRLSRKLDEAIGVVVTQ